MSTNSSTNSSSTYFPETPEQAGVFWSYWGIFWTNYVVYIVCCLLVIVTNLIWRKEQPLKSRLITPAIIMFSQMAYVAVWVLMLQVPTVAYWNQTFPRDFNIASLTLRAASWVLLELSTAAYSIQVIRYLVLRHYTLVQRQEYTRAVQTTRNPGEAIPKPTGRNALLLRWYRVVLSTPFYVVWVLLPGVFFVPLSALFLGLEFGLPGYTAPSGLLLSDFLYYFFLGYMIIFLAVPCMIAFLVDVAVNAKVIFSRGGLRHFFVDADPLLFRVEAAVVFIEVLFAILGPVINRIPVSSSFDRRWTVRWVGNFFLALYYWSTLFRSGGIAAIATMRSVLRKKKLGLFNHNNSPSGSLATDKHTQSQLASNITDPSTKTGRTRDLYEVLLNEHGSILFEAYCKAEFSVENLLAWREVIAFQKTHVPQERTRIAELLMDQFIDMGSIMEVNISNDQRLQVKAKMDENRARLLEAAGRQIALDIPASTPTGQLNSPGSPSVDAAAHGAAPMTPRAQISVPTSPSTPADTEALMAQAAAVEPPSPVPESDLSSSKSANGRSGTVYKSVKLNFTHSQQQQQQDDDGVIILPQNLFEAIQRTLEQNLLDTFSRFVNTAAYRNFKTNAENLMKFVKKSNFA